MSLFSKSDKMGPSFDDLLSENELDLVDLNNEFDSTKRFDKSFFGLFSKEEIKEMLIEANIFDRLEERGYLEYELEVEPISELDNRIYIRNQYHEVLVHMRLKVGNLTLSKLDETYKMVYIDWLLSQNVNFGKLPDKKKLFEGQEYPGLNIMKEVTAFISDLMIRIGAKGVFNVPEYFHDAVLFHKNFKFVNPKKEGLFRKLLHTFRTISLRNASRLIHEEKIFYKKTGVPYQWKYGEMLYTKDLYLTEKLFDKKYEEEARQAYKEEFEIRNGELS